MPKQAPPDRCVLVVEDDEAARALYHEALSAGGYEVVGAASAAEAQAAMAERTFAAAVLDVFLPDGRGLWILNELRDHDPQAVAIVVTGFASLETALSALRLGAYEYLCKPFTADQLLRALNRGLERRALILSNLHLAHELAALAQQLQADRASLQGEVHRARASLTAFAELSDRLSSADEASAALDVLCETAARLSGSELAALLVPREGGYQVAACHDAEARLARGQVLPESSLLRAAADQGRPVLSEDLLFGKAATDDHLASRGLGSALCLPARADSALAGLLLCAREATGGFGEEACSLLGLLASQAAPSLRHWREGGDDPGAGAGDGFVEIDRLL